MAAEFEIVLRTFRMSMDPAANDEIIFIGFFRNDNPDGAELKAFLSGKPLPVEVKINEGLDIRRKYLAYNSNVSQEVVGKIRIPADFAKHDSFRLETVLKGYSITVFSLKDDELSSFVTDLPGNLDYAKIEEDGKLHISGWSTAGKDAVFSLKDQNGAEIPLTVTRRFRRDAIEDFPELDRNFELGYEAVCEFENPKGLVFSITDGQKSHSQELPVDALRRGREYAPTKNVFKKTVHFLKKNGMKQTVKKIFSKMVPKKGPDDQAGYDEYMEYVKAVSPTEEELQKQRETVFSFAPKISIVIPIYKTPKNFLKELLDSIEAQTYPNWQLCLADGSGTDELLPYIRECTNNDERISYRLLDSNEGISENTNRAIEIADGEFIAFSDHDDLLCPDALFEVVKALNLDPEIDSVYTDEDKIDMDGQTLYMPHFKSDFNIDLLCSHNYITHLFVTRRTVIDEVGMLRGFYDGSQDHDMIFRSVEKSRRVYHVPKVLYHWRCHKNSTAMNPESKMYCYEAGRNAVKSHFERLGIPAEVSMAPNYGYYRTAYHWNKEPLVSVIIPNKDHSRDLATCIDSIAERSIYKKLEFIIVENNSTEEKTFSYYEELKKRTDIDVKVVKYEGAFNYSKINNFGVKNSSGELLLFLNNDTELIEKNSIKEMADICLRPDVGAVGARLYYADNSIQHAGVILGVGGIANHAFLGLDRGEVGYFFRSVCVQDLSAVTAACMMTSKAEFEAVGGFCEDLAVAFNDVDYCMNVRKSGKLVVFTPFSEWYHYESKSRGYEDTPEKRERLEKESEIFLSRWQEIKGKCDPYYNPNFNQDRADFTLRKLESVGAVN